jgi:hypothetical protein
MKSNAPFIHKKKASYTSICHRVVLWVLGFLCFSTTGFSQQLDQPPSVPEDPNGLIGPTDSSNLPATASQTPVPAPVPAPTRGKRIKEEWLIGLELGSLTIYTDPVHGNLMGFQIGYQNNPPKTELIEFHCCWISCVGKGWTLEKNGKMKFTHNALCKDYQESDTHATWSLSGDILTLKMSHKCARLPNLESARREENSLVELKIEQCEHRITEDELQKYVASGGHFSFSVRNADGWNNAQKDQFDFYCVNYQSQRREVSRNVLGEIDVFEGYALGHGKTRNLKHNGPPFFVGRMKLNTNSEPGTGVPPSPTVPAIAGPAVAAINELEQDCQRSSLDQQNQETPPSEDPSIIRRQQIILSVNGRSFPVNVVVHNRDEFWTDIGTRTPTIHIGLPGPRWGDIARYHRGVTNEMATIITDANDGEFDGIMTDASGQPLSPLATEAFSDRFSADYLAYQRLLFVPSPTSTPKNPLDRYLAPLEQADRSLTESLLHPRQTTVANEPYYADEQGNLNARADVFSEADRLIRDGRLDDAFALFKMNSDIIGRAYYCKLLETYEHYFPEKAQRKQEQ